MEQNEGSQLPAEQRGETMEVLVGAFSESLKRSNRKIRDDRAEAISEDAQVMFKRRVEDLDLQIKRKKRERDSLLDLSPTDANSLTLAADFNSASFVEKDLKIGFDIRNLEIMLDIAKQRYTYLFGAL